MSTDLQNTVAFCELDDFALLETTGPDAAPFLHAQLTSDVAALSATAGQWSGYCSPKGRLFATMIVWRIPEGFLLQMPRSLAEVTRARLSRFILRSKVSLRTTAGEVTLFGLIGDRAAESIGQMLHTPAPERLHVSENSGGIRAFGLDVDRFILMCPRSGSAEVGRQLQAVAHQQDASQWHLRDIHEGLPWITEVTAEAFVPQMVNLDLLGGVSYNKGCYPGQEIVARTHYLGRLKQRMHRIVVRTDTAPAPGDALYSEAFGPEQSCGTLLQTARLSPGEYTGLAVIQHASLADPLHLQRLRGTRAELASLPYAVPNA